MPIKKKSMKLWEKKFWKMLGMAIIVVYLHMGKQDLVKAIQWWDMMQMKVLNFNLGVVPQLCNNMFEKI